MNEIKMNETNTQAPDTKKPARTKLGELPAYAGTPGAAYVDGFLPGFGEQASEDDQWIADRVNDGTLLACSRCRFLHLPAFPLPLLRRAADPAPVDACDVCAHAWSAAELEFQPSADQMLSAREGLVEARSARARLFFELWVGASEAADTWVLAALGQVLRGVKEVVQTAG